MATLNAESSLAYIQNAYQTIDRLHLSMTSLAVIALIVGIAFLFAVREVAAWFFKIDDLKRDLRNLEESIGRLEGEVRNLQLMNKGAEEAPLHEPSVETVRRSEQFPINH